MSIWNSGCNDVHNETSQILQGFSRKSYAKLNPIGKLQVIHALDNGHCKTDIAREYGVHPQTITYIYKQKDWILKKYTQKYNLKQVNCYNLEQTLLEWLKQQTKNGNVVKEEQLRMKAQDVIKNLSEEFDCVDEWLLDFRLRHNILKFTSNIDCSAKVKEEWIKFLKGIDINKMYFGGICALSYSHNFNDFVRGKELDNYVSLLYIFNCVGSDKKELAVVSKESLDTESNVKSLPVTYFHCNSPQINYSVVVSYLKKWDNDLRSEGKNVLLALNIPDKLIEKLHFERLKIVSTNNIKYVTKIIEKITECFKYHYRKLQIRKIIYDKESYQPTQLDYIDMISTAWYNVSSRYIQHLMFPPENGSLYFDKHEDNEGDHSLSQWCKVNSIPLNFEQYSNLLDKFTVCDKKLSCFNWGQFNDNVEAVNHQLMQNDCQSSGMEAYQAMKRIVCYLRGENAGETVMKNAKSIENQLEYGALLQMHQILASTNDST